MRNTAPLVDDSPKIIWRPPSEAAPQAEAAVVGEDDLPAFATELSRAPLGTAAMPLLAVIVSLRRSDPPRDLFALRQHLAAAIGRFERSAIDAGCLADHVVAARYMLCSALDEAVATAPWGSGGEWSKYSLLAQFHNETWGGEKVFMLLDRIRQDPQRYHDLLEVGAYLLALGFEGKYRVINNGRVLLEEIRSDLMRQIRPRPTDPDDPVAAPFRPLAKSFVLRSYVPLRLVFVGAAIFVLVIYIVFESLLLAQADPVIDLLDRIGTAHGTGAS
jgi:type VI secretion system protein ImpK